MRLLLIFPSTQRGGVEAYALTIATAAVKEGWEVHTAFPNTEGTASLIQDFQIQGINYHQLEIAEKSTNKLTAVVKHFLHLLRTVLLLLKIKPNIIQINLPWADYSLGSILACGFLKIPTFVVFHLIPGRFSISSIKLKTYAWARARNQQWMAISKHTCKLVSESFKIPQEQLLCIYNGTKLIASINSSDREDINRLRTQVRQELGLPETNQLALTVGRLHPQKGHLDLLPAIPHIIKEFPEVRFVWVGDGELRECLNNKVREYGVEHQVLLIGYRSDIPRLLKSADLFVFPTHYEGQPFALLEAMAHSLPIIASHASAIPEVIENRIHGLLFRTGDSCDLLENLRTAFRNPEFIQKIAQNASLRVQEFSEQKMIEGTLMILSQFSCTCRSIETINSNAYI